MNSRRPQNESRAPQQHRFGGGDPARHAEPYARHQAQEHGDGRGPERDPWRADSDRFGGYTGAYGSPSREDWGQGPWDEDRFAYPESGSPGRHAHRGQGQGPTSRKASAWSDAFETSRYGGSTQVGPRNFAPRGPGQEFGRSFDPAVSPGYRSQRFGRHHEGSLDSFGGDGDAWSSADTVHGYGIPSGSEPGGYGFNSPWRGGAQNWSGSNWRNDREPQQPGGARSVGGRPPKGYTRSDERIRDDVCEQLCRSRDVDVGEVSVEVKNGTVTLEGSVADRRMKHRIEDLCEQCIGVNDVDNRIRVVREQAGGLGQGSWQAAGTDRAGMSDRSDATMDSGAARKPPTGSH